MIIYQLATKTKRFAACARKLRGCPNTHANHLQWASIWDHVVSNPLLTQEQVAKDMRCSKGLVNKVCNSNTKQPSLQGGANNVVFDQFAYDLTLYWLNNKCKPKEIQRKLGREAGIKAGRSTVYHHIKHTIKYTKQVSLKEDPRKWSVSNTKYYIEYLMWMHSLPEADRFGLKFFDECKCLQTGTHLLHPSLCTYERRWWGSSNTRV